MPRIRLNPELMVLTSAPGSDRTLGELPVALGYQFPPSSKKTIAPAEVSEKGIKDRPTEVTTAEEKRIVVYERERSIAELSHAPIEGAGRPTLFRSDYIRIGFNLTLLGSTEKQMASALGVTVETIQQWKNIYPQFSVAIREGKDIADSNVGRSLYEQAVGYWGPDGNWYPPQLGAAKHWLAVRQPQKWATTDPALVHVNVGPQVEINTLNPIEAAKQYQDIMRLDRLPSRVIEHVPDDTDE